MRRIVALFFVLSPPGWAQPAQQPAQPPTVVKVETAPESVWTTLVRLVIPTILGGGLGAGLALYGVRLTNRHHAVESAANRQHQLDIERMKAKNAAQAANWDDLRAFRKGVYCHLIETTSELISNLAQFRHIRLQNGVTAPLEERRLELTKELMNYARLASLATDNICGALEAAKPAISGANVDFSCPEWPRQISDTIGALEALLKSFQDSARKDLWGAP